MNKKYCNQDFTESKSHKSIHSLIPFFDIDSPPFLLSISVYFVITFSMNEFFLGCTEDPF